MTRVYVPADLHLLGRWHAEGRVSGGPERLLAQAETDDDEAAALEEAAADSAALVGPGGRRVVVVAEVAGDPDGDLAWRDVVAVHADLGEVVRPADDLAWVATQEVPRLLDGTLDASDHDDGGAGAGRS